MKAIALLASVGGVLGALLMVLPKGTAPAARAVEVGAIEPSAPVAVSQPAPETPGLVAPPPSSRTTARSAASASLSAPAPSSAAPAPGPGVAPTAVPMVPAAGATVDIRTAGSRPLIRQVLGFNTNNAGGEFPYQDSTIATAIVDLGTSLLRFPGGTVGNFYHWKTGKFDIGNLDGPEGARVNALTTANARRLQANGGTLSFDDFMIACQRAKVAPLVMINVLTGTPEESAAWVQYAKDKGYTVRGWEIGNELYLPAYRTRFPDAEAFIKVARAHVSAMRAVDPSLRVAVPAAEVGFHPGGARAEAQFGERWNRTLAGEKFFNAYAVHLYTYPRLKQANALEGMRGYLFGTTDVALPSAVKYYSDLFGSRRMWVTEWNVGNPENPIANTQLHAMFLGDFFLGLVDAGPVVDIAAYHLLVGRGTTFPLLSPAQAGEAGAGRYVRRAGYFTFQVIGETFRGATTQFTVSMSGLPSVPGSMEYTGRTLPGLRAVAVGGTRPGFLLVSNRTAREVPLTLTLDGTPFQGQACVRSVGNASLEATNGGNAVIQASATDGVSGARTCGDIGQLRLPANSFSSVSLP